uniref:G_PROTEIN_RECEP_F1_2 domain-containing protein n=1 Tax=Rhabditophanes sp. KR3021 TaxID=114890 RepID=A0AC35U6N4_9BILA
MNASWGVYFLTILYLVLGCICLCGNVWVLMTVIYHLKQHRTFSAANYRWVSAPVMQSSAIIYLIALSVVDLVSIVCAPMLVHDIILNQWPYGVIMCKVFFVCENANKSLSPLILTALSVDRYIAVCHSGMQWLRETKFAITVIFICISISLLFTIPVVSESGVNPLNDRKDVEHSKCVVVMSMTFDVLHTAACYVLPLIFILSVYIAIFNRLYWHTRYSKVGQKTAINLTRVVRSSVLVVAFYFICWTPYWTHRIYYIMTRRMFALF